MQSRWILATLAALSFCISACATSTVVDGSGGNPGSGGEGGDAGNGGSGGTGGNGGTGGGTPCVFAEECAAFTDQCNVGACINGTCTGFPTNEDDLCDDGAACTLTEVCKAGVCTTQTEKFCPASDSCHVGTCDVATDSCTEAPGNDGAGCIDDDPCTLTGICTSGACAPGQPVDCSFLDGPCSVGSCDPQIGCVVMPQNDGFPCEDGLFCTDLDQCMAGACNGVPKACSPPGNACQIGTCDEFTNTCIATPGNDGAACDDGDVCTAAETCSAGLCLNGVPANPGAACNDHNTCTESDVCGAGTCAGSPVADCDFFFEHNFEDGCPPAGWTLGGDWECGAPMNVGPSAAYEGALCIGTQIDADYNDNQTYGSNYAQTPTIGLGSATFPVVQFAAWVDTESCCDGVNLKISTDGGASFSVVQTVTPPYNLNINLEPAWGSEGFTNGWEIFSADLTAYAGQNVILRYSFHTDVSVVYPGIYIDDIVVSEAEAIPLVITSPSLSSALVGEPYLGGVQKSGGTPNSVWSIVGGMNNDWLSIDPATGQLIGTPLAANLGAFNITVRVEEPTLPSNFDEKVLAGSVVQGVYSQSFEGACPNGWTLGGDWECGQPTGPGPGSAYDGLNCIATQIDGDYNDGQSYATATATSPPIDLTGTASPQLQFRMWVVTEGFGLDGVNLKVSTNGVNFVQVMTVDPPYNDIVGGEPAWSGDLSALDWQLVTVNLAAYAGQTVYLRFAFQTDLSVTYPGIYIDGLFIAD